MTSRRLVGLAICAALGVAALVGLAYYWSAGAPSIHDVVAWFERIRSVPYMPLLVIVAFPLLGLISFPATILMAAAGLLFGPVFGLVVSSLGIASSASLLFWIGRLSGQPFARRVGGAFFAAINRQLAHQGIIATAMIRNIPAPFSVVSVVAGATEMRFRDYLVGTLCGLAPLTIALVVLGDRLQALIADPNPKTITVIIAAVAATLLVAYGLQVWANRRRVRSGESN